MQVEHQPAQHRFIVSLAAGQARLEYSLQESWVNGIHTRVPDSLRGQGAADARCWLVCSRNSSTISWSPPVAMPYVGWSVNGARWRLRHRGIHGASACAFRSMRYAGFGSASARSIAPILAAETPVGWPPWMQAAAVALVGVVPTSASAVKPGIDRLVARPAVIAGPAGAEAVVISERIIRLMQLVVIVALQPDLCVSGIWLPTARLAPRVQDPMEISINHRLRSMAGPSAESRRNSARFSVVSRGALGLTELGSAAEITNVVMGLLQPGGGHAPDLLQPAAAMVQGLMGDRRPARDPYFSPLSRGFIKEKR